MADPWQGLGLGTKMVDYTIEICKEVGVETLYAIMLPDNHRAINLTKKMGFTLKYQEDGTVKGVLNLKEETMQCQETGKFQEKRKIWAPLPQQKGRIEEAETVSG